MQCHTFNFLWPIYVAYNFAVTFETQTTASNTFKNRINYIHSVVYTLNRLVDLQSTHKFSVCHQKLSPYFSVALKSNWLSLCYIIFFGELCKKFVICRWKRQKSECLHVENTWQLLDRHTQLYLLQNKHISGNLYYMGWVRFL